MIEKKKWLFLSLISLTVFLFINVNTAFGVVDRSLERAIKIHKEIASLKTKQEKLKYCLEKIYEDALSHEGYFKNVSVGIDTNLAELVWIGRPAIPELIKLLRDDTPAGCIGWGACEKEDTVAEKALWVLRMFCLNSFETYNDDCRYYCSGELPPSEKREEFIQKWQEWWQKIKHRKFDTTYEKESKTKIEPFARFGRGFEGTR